MSVSIICNNCEQPYDPVASRWQCPRCGWKDTCCEGEPLPQRAPDDVGQT